MEMLNPADEYHMYTSIIHTMPETIHSLEYRQNLIEFYSELRQWGDNFKTHVNEERKECFHRAAKILQGSLAEFLTLPLRSDVEELKKIIIEQLQELFTTPLSHHLKFNVNGYKYLFPTTLNAQLKKIYTHYFTQYKKQLSPTTTTHGLFETWFYFSHVEFLYHLELFIRNNLTEKYNQYFSSVAVPIVTSYILVDRSTKKLVSHRYKGKIVVKSTQHNSTASYDLLTNTLSEFSWYHLQSHLLPSYTGEEVFVFEFSDREELHHFRDIVRSDLQKGLKRNNPNKLTLSIGEFEKLEESETL
ncbi:MAG: hypothetical protein N3A63_00175 [Bacteroidetes bacterium]|nr:hypothetical protein [Bacteroidota bacterium]